MHRSFFPDPVFAWIFCGVLFLLTCVAAWTDTRKAIVPNRLTVLILILGLVANVIRGVWLAAENRPLPLSWFDSDSEWLGALNGFLFGLTGFAVAFAIMFAIWIFGLCGGGDVKLLGAVSAWVGFMIFPYIWVASVFVLFFWMLARIFSGGLSPRKLKRAVEKLQEQKQDRAAGKAPVLKRGKVRATYSLPLAIATAAVLLYLFRVELLLSPPKPPQPDQTQGAVSHARPSPNQT